MFGIAVVIELGGETQPDGSDKMGQVLARVWERAPELAETFEEGDVVKVPGDGAAEVVGKRIRRSRATKLAIIRS